MREFTDKEIVECLRNRESYVVRYLSDKYLSMIRLMVTKYGGTSEDAKDVFQDGLIIMLEKLDNPDFVLTSRFKTLLFSVCFNLWRDTLDKRQSAQNYLNRRLDDTTHDDFTEDYDYKLYENLIYDVFSTLDPVCQEMLKLYWQEFTPREIAEKLGYTSSYVRTKRCECQKLMTKRMQDHPDYKFIKESEENIKHVVRE